MPLVPFILMVIAGVLFLIDAFRLRSIERRFFQSLGLAFLTAGLIFEFILKTTGGLVVIH
jgi:hypothetical protein